MTSSHTHLPPFKAIAAMSLNRVIGKANALPWNIPEELLWFKKNTLNQTILMGRKTFDSIGKLPRRQSIVLSKSTNHIDGVNVIHNLQELLPHYAPPSSPIWVIGGSELYQLTLPYTSDLFLSEIKTTIPDGDAFFPKFEHLFTQSTIIEDNPTYKITHYINPNPLIINIEKIII